MLNYLNYCIFVIIAIFNYVYKYVLYVSVHWQGLNLLLFIIYLMLHYQKQYCAWC